MSGMIRAASGDHKFNPDGYSPGVQESSGHVILNHRERVDQPYQSIPPSGGIILNFKHMETNSQ